jgi:hypothetical protein
MALVNSMFRTFKQRGLNVGNMEESRKIGAERMRRWLRTPANLIVLGALWILCSLAIVTSVAATGGLFSALHGQNVDDSDAVVAPFFFGIRRTWRPLLSWTAIVVPAFAVQIVVTIVLLDVGSTPAVLALGVVSVVSVVWWSFVLVVHAAISRRGVESIGPTIGVAFVEWLRQPTPSIVAVLVGLSIVAAAFQTFGVLAVFAMSVPAWIVNRYCFPSTVVPSAIES